MLTARLTVGTILNLASAGLCLAVGARLARRDVQGPARRAAMAFSVWWMALGVDATINSVTWLAGALGLATETLTAVLTYAALAAVTVMLWGLVEYLVYLFTGRAGAFFPVAAAYVVAFLAGAAFIATLHPIGVTPRPYGGEIAYANQPSPGEALAFAVFFLLPPILGALAYGTLFFSAKGRTRRFRIGVVSLGIFVWFSSSIALSGTTVESDALALSSFAISIFCMLAILAAYAPPAWMQRWLRVTAIASEPHPMPEALAADAARREGAAARARRRARLDERVRDLV